MKKYAIARLSVFGMLLLFLTSCSGTGGLPNSRSISHTYQDPNGLNFISLFDTGDPSKGLIKKFGIKMTERPVTIPKARFDELWMKLTSMDLKRYQTKGNKDTFDAMHNYVISYGIMPEGNLKTFVIPKSKASPEVRQVVRVFRGL